MSKLYFGFDNCIQIYSGCRQLILRLSLIFITVFYISNKSYSQDCTIGAGFPGIKCTNAAILLNGTRGGNFTTSGITSRWSQISGPSVTILNATSTVAGSITHVATISGALPGVYTFQFYGVCNSGVNTSQTVAYTFVGISTASASDMDVCPTANFTLSGNNPGTGETSFWNVSGGTSNITTVSGNNSPNLVFTATAGTGGTTTFKYNITNGSCTSTKTVNVRNPSGVTPVSAGSNQTLSNCYTTTQSLLSLSGSNQGTGALGQTGTWSVVNGPNIPAFNSKNSRNAILTNLIQGTYQLRWTVSGPCTNGSADVFITVPAPTQSVSTAVSTTQNFCDPRTSAVISGTNPGYANEIVTWTTLSGPGSIVNPNSASASITGLNGSSQSQFRYTILNTVTGCNSTATSTINYATSTPGITLSTGALSVLGCNVSGGSIVYNISATNVSNTWAIISGPKTTTSNSFTSTSGNISFSLLTTSGTYTFRVTSQANNGIGTCPVGQQDTKLVISQSPSGINAGTNPSVACNVFTSQFAASTPLAGIGSWSQVSGPNAAVINNPFLNNAILSGMTNGTYVFRWTVSGGPGCTPLTQDVTATIASVAPSAAAAGVDQSVCNLTPVFLNANVPTQYEQGAWSVSPSSAGVNFYPSINYPTPSVSGFNAGQVYTVTWTVFNSCASNTSSATITVSTIAGPIQADAGPDICMIGAFTTATLSGNNPAPAGATGLWTQLSGPGSATFSSNTVGGTALSSLTNGTYSFEWRLDRGGCNPTRDTVKVTIAVATVAGANAGANQNICGSAVQLAGNNVTSVTGLWTQVSGPGGPSIINPNLYNTSVTGLADGGNYIFRWTLVNGACGPRSSDVTVNASYPPTTLNAGINKTICGTGIALLSATGVGSSFTWSLIGSAPSLPTYTSGSTSPVTSVTGLETGLYTFRGTNFGGSFCPATTSDVVVAVSINADGGIDASNGNSYSYCNASSLSLNGFSGTGNWSQTIGPAASLTSVSGTSANVTSLTSGIYTFRYTAPAVYGCPATNDDIMVTISGSGTTPNAGPDQLLCNTTSALLAGNTTFVGTGLWTIASGTGGTILGASLPNATITGMAPGVDGTTLSGVYILQWNISNGSCSSFSDIVRIETSALPTTANAGPDQLTGCSSTTTLAGNNPTFGLGTWTQLGGPNTANINNPVLNNSLVTNLTLGGYSFQWTITNGNCPVSTSIVGITISGLPPTVANAGTNQGLCNASITTLSGNAVTGSETGTWSRVSGPGTPSFTPNASVTGPSLSGLSAGVYIYQYQIAYNSCISNALVTVTNSKLPTTASITGATFQSNCPFVIPTITGNAALTGTGTWLNVSGPNTPIFQNPTSVTSAVTGIVPGDYVFRWSISSGFCPSSFADITVTSLVNCPPSTPNFTFTGFEDQLLQKTITGWTDPDNFIPTITGGVFVTAQGGSITLSGINATVTSSARASYQPPLDFNGIDTYTYQVCDNYGACASGTITYSITGVNDAPVARNMTITGTAGFILTNSLTLVTYSTVPGAVYDVDNSVLTVNGTLVLTSTGTLKASTTNGQLVTIGGNGAITYLSSTTFSGIDTYNLSVCDPLTCTSAVITFSVTGSLLGPIGVNDVNTTTEKTPVSSTLLGNDFNPLTGNGTGLTVTGITSSPRGSIIITNSITGAYTFTPNMPSLSQGVVTTVGYTYTLCNKNACTTAGLTISVTGVNDPPVAVVNTFTGVIEDNTFCATITGFSDPDNIPTVTAGIFSVTGGGSITITGTNGAFCYNAGPDVFGGPFTVPYSVCDPFTCTSSNLVFSVTGVNDPPVLNPDMTSTGVNTPVSLCVLCNDFDIDGTITGSSIQILSSTPGLAGSLTVNSITGIVTYTPTAIFTGVVSFVYRACDNGTPLPSLCGTTTGTITVSGTGPVANPDFTSTGINTSVGICVLCNDTGGPLDPLSVSVPPSTIPGVTVSVNPLTGYVTFTSTAPGIKTFTYSVCSIFPVSCVSALVTVSVTGTAPVANPDVTTTGISTPVSICVLCNDTGGPLNPGSVTIPASTISGVTTSVNTTTGIVTFNSTTPGIKTFTYNVCSIFPVSCTGALVTVSVTGTPPVANPDVTTTGVGNPVAICVLCNDTGGPLNPGSVTVPTSTIPGVTISVNTTTGIVTFNSTAPGVRTFTYNVCSIFPVSCTSALVTVSVSGTAPVANPDVTTTGISTPVAICILCNDTGGPFNPGSITIPPSTIPGTTISINTTTGIVTYTSTTPGIQTFTYNVCSTFPVSCTSAIVTVSVTGTPPVANPDVTTTGIGTPVAICILCNDTGGPLNPASITIPASTIPGVTISVNTTTGIVTFNSTAPGVRTFTYNVCSIFPVSCTSALVTVSVSGTAPVANPDATTTGINTPVAICILCNDTGGPLNTATITTTGVVNGSIAVNTATGIVTFSPQATFTGITTFNYQVCSIFPVNCTGSTVTVSVTGTPPVANPDLTTTGISTPVSICVLCNDTGGPLNPGSITVSTPTVPGTTISVNTTTGIVGFTSTTPGIQTFTYNVCSIFPVSCTSAIVTVSVTGIPPVANPDVTTTGIGTPVAICILCNDTGGPLDPGSVTVSTPTVPGTTISVNTTTGIVTFSSTVPGIQTFTYNVCSIFPVSCTSALVTVSVTGTPPVANPDETITGINTPADICILCNDTGGPLDPGSVTVSTSTVPGTTISVNTATGIVTFNSTVPGIQTFTYNVCSIFPVSCTSALVTVSVTGTPPVANPDETITGINTPADICVLCNDTGGPFDPATVTVPTSTITGVTISVNTATGIVTYNSTTPGIQTFTYNVCSIFPVSCTSALVTVSVTGTSPLANPDETITGINTPADICILCNDTGGPLDPGSVTVSTSTVPGTTISVNTATGIVTFNSTVPGIQTFTYNVCSIFPVSCTSALVTVSVTGTPPVANPDETITGINTPADICVLCNDTGGPFDPATVTVPTSTIPGVTISVNTATGVITYNSTTLGIQVFTYNVCSIFPVSCTSAIVTVSVTGAPPVLHVDTASTVAGNPISVCILCNDTGGPLDPGSITLTPITVPGGGISVNTTTGSISFISTVPGVYAYDYNVCTQYPVTCLSSMLTITVIPRVITVTASALCIKDAAYVNYSVTATNFDATGMPVTMNWLDSLGNTITVVSGLAQSGSVLWPGAVTDTDGNGIDWPGWVFENGIWVKGDDGFQALRPHVKVVFQVNPTYELILNYPPSTSTCKTDPAVSNTPVPSNSTITGGLEDTPFTGSITGFTDPDGNVLTVTSGIFTTSGNGMVTISGDGSFSYIPAPNYNGTDCFNYTVCNAASICASGNWCIVVAAVNDPPVAVSDSTTDHGGIPVTFTIAGNDFDIDGTVVPASIDLDPTVTGIQKSYTLAGEGTFTVDDLGNVTFTPVASFSGIAIIAYVISDNDGGISNKALITITVTAAPVSSSSDEGVPEGFSPNGDGNNDEFYIRPRANSSKVTLTVFNRWGNIVYEASQYLNDWKGKPNKGLVVDTGDGIVPDGTYFIIVDFNNGDNKVVKSITIMR